MRFFDVEDRLVALAPGDASAFVFDGGGWRMTSVAHARKALADGIPLQGEELLRAFPAAMASLPDTMRAE